MPKKSRGYPTRYGATSKSKKTKKKTRTREYKAIYQNQTSSLAGTATVIERKQPASIRERTSTLSQITARESLVDYKRTIADLQRIGIITGAVFAILLVLALLLR